MNNGYPQSKIYIGLMSGTSCDGLDIVGLVIEDYCNLTRCKLMFFEHYSYSDQLKNNLLHYAVTQSIELNTLAQFEIELTQLYAKYINDTLNKHQLCAEQITAIGLHGQTIRHDPNHPFPHTWQLGEPSVLAALTQIDIISHFRQSNVANGGQGAPLAPIFHRQLLQQSNSKDNNSQGNEIVLNLGGIANMSCFYANHHCLAFDTGPANTLLDAWVREKKLNAKGFDEQGILARQGKVHQKLLSTLLNESYFHQTTPKSTGRELFNLQWLESHLNHIRLETQDEINTIDVLTTLTALTTESIVMSIPPLADTEHENWQSFWLCGGGVHNTFLIQCIEEKLKKRFPNMKIDRLEKKVCMSGQAIEASAWAWLAYLYHENIALDLQSITGSNKKSILGRLTKH